MTANQLIRFLDSTGKGWQGTVELGKNTIVPIKYEFNGIRFSHMLNSVAFGGNSDVRRIKIWEQ